MRILVSILILFLSIHSTELLGQNLFYKNYDWEKNPTPVKLDAKDSAFLEIVLFEKKSSEFNFGPDGGLYEYYLFHQKIKVNSDEAIEKNNKIYLPNNLEIIFLKARTISADGKIKELDRDDIIESEENNGKKYKYFALEGIEKGSEIEQILFLKINPRVSGHIQNAQSNLYKKRFEFELISPENLLFKFKSLNGFPEIKLDSTVRDRNFYKASIDQLQPIKAEKFAAVDPYKMGVLYKLRENKETGTRNIYNYSRIAENVYNSAYGDYKKNKNAIAKYLKKNQIKEGDPERETILKLEELLKTDRIILDFNLGIGNGNMDEMLKSPFSTSDQMIKMMGQLCNFLNIEHQIVMTSNRFDVAFDKDFESYNFLEEYLIYFPKSKLYIAPGDHASRSMYITPGFYNNYGLFLHPVKVADYVTAVGKINFIEPLDNTTSTDSLYMRCNLTDDFSKFKISYERIVTGFYAKNYQPYYQYFDEEYKKEVNESYTEFLTDNLDEVKSITVKNVEKNDFPKKPLVTQAELECDKFIEEAGEKVLIKLGELIGPQAELYQEGTRVLPIENSFNRTYYRRIEFTIPDGYKISNPEGINLDVAHKDEKGSVTMAFKSEYKITGQKLVILCSEFYNQLSYPVKDFEEFRKVINAAADFNKITLVLEKI